MHYYKFHIGDYRGATAHLTNEEDLAYRRLLDMYYDTEKPIPLDVEMVARKVRVGADSVNIILKEFFRNTVNGWTHERCDFEVFEYNQKCVRNREAGKLGGRPKKTQTLKSGNPDVTLTINHKPLATKKSRANFIPPSLEEVKSFCLERKNGVDPERWYNFYKAKDWMIGKNKMRDWRAAVRTWESGEQKGAGKKEIKIGGYTFDA